MRFYSTLYAFFVLLLTFNIYAQVPNNSFEQWTDGNPDGWSTNNFVNIATPITQSTDAHSGSYAVRGDVVSTGSGVLQPIIITGEIGKHGTPITERYTSLTGYYKLNAVTNENISIVLAPYKNGSLIGVGGTQFFAASEYTKFVVPILYSRDGTPDSCQISITIGNNSGSTTLGSYFIIDDLEYEGIATDVDETINLAPNNFSLEQNYPNPFNPTTKIKYTISTPSKSSPLSKGRTEEGFTQIKVYDILGNEIATLVNEEKQAGTYEVEFDGSKLSSGMYLYRLQVGTPSSSSGWGYVETRKMILLR